MRTLRITVGTAIVLCLTFASIEAAPKGKGSAPVKVSKAPAAAKVTPSPKTTSAPKTKATSAPKAKATAPPKTTAKVTKAPKATTTTAKASSSPKSKAPKTSETKLAKAETRSAKKSGTTSTATTSTTTTSATTPTTVATIDFTQGKVGEKLTRNTKLADKLANQLTTLGYTGDVYEAAYGFKNLGQFVAAVNNAQNHDLSFEQLKTLMTGVSVDPDGVVLYANRNPDGTVTLVPLEDVTVPAPTLSLGQAKKAVGSLSLVPPTTTTTPPTTTTTTTTVAR